MIRAVLFDIDGVIILKDFVSKRLAKEYDVPMEKILPFFENEFKLCGIGKADLKEELKKYLPIWKWDKTVDDFLIYWFEGKVSIDERILKFVKMLQDKGIKCYLTSDQEKYRADFLLNTLGLDKYFDGHFISHELGHFKSENKFYEKIVQNLKIKSQDIIFWDDEEENVEVAKLVGIDARLFESAEDFISKSNRLINDWKK